MSTQHDERIPVLTLGWRLQMALGEGSAQEMADYLGVSRATVSRWMHDKGAPPRNAYIAQWALKTGVPLKWLRDGIDPRTGGDDGGGNIAPSAASSSLSSGPPTSSYPVLVAAA